MLLYDHLLTFDQEVEEIWKAKWTLPKSFFLILRYLVPSVLIIQTYRDCITFLSQSSLFMLIGWFPQK